MSKRTSWILLVGGFLAVWVLSVSLRAAEKQEGFFLRDISLKQAKDLAQKEGKLLLVDVMTDWCPPCKMMEHNTWPNAQVQEYFRTKGLAYQVDGDKDRPAVEELNIEYFPTLIVFQDGKELERQVGYLSPQELLTWMANLEKGQTHSGVLRYQSEKAPPGPLDITAKLDLMVSFAEAKDFAKALSMVEWLVDNLHEQAPALEYQGLLRLRAQVNILQQMAPDLLLQLDEQAKTLAQKVESGQASVNEKRAFVCLNYLQGTTAAPLAWFDGIKQTPAGLADMQALGTCLTMLLVKVNRWTDLYLLDPDPSAAFAKMKQDYAAGMDTFAQWPEGDRRTRTVDLMEDDLRARGSLLYAGLLAAGKTAPAQEIAKALFDALDDGHTRVVAVKMALSAHQALAEHRLWLKEAKEKDEDVAQLSEKLEQALTTK